MAAIYGNLFVMSIIAPLLTFSYTYCISICAFLVPFSLFMTFGSIYHVAAGHQRQLYITASLASLAAGFMIFHAWSWWIVDVVMLPSYILPIVAVVCLAMNSWAVGHQRSLSQVILPCVTRSRSAYSKFIHH